MLTEHNFMRRFTLIIAGLMMLVGAASAMSAILPNTTAPGYNYVFSANLSALNATACIITAQDKFGFPAKVWTTNGDGFSMFTNRRGVINSYVRIDDSFVQGENYTFNLACGDEAASMLVSMGTGGSLGINIWALNRIDWLVVHPDEGALAIAVAIALLLIAGIAYGFTRNRRGRR